MRPITFSLGPPSQTPRLLPIPGAGQCRRAVAGSGSGEAAAVFLPEVFTTAGLSTGRAMRGSVERELFATASVSGSLPPETACNRRWGEGIRCFFCACCCLFMRV